MHTAIATSHGTCICTKKIFPSLEAAQTFAERLLQYPDSGPKQRAYECSEISGNYHLTRLPEGVYEEITVAKNTVSSPIYKLGAPEERKSKYADKHAEFVALHEQGMSIQRIADQTGVPYNNVHGYLRYHGHIDSPPKTTTKAPTTITELEEQERKYREIKAEADRALANIEAKKAELTEAGRLKSFPGEHGLIVIKRHDDFLRLPIDVAHTLVKELSTFLTQVDTSPATPAQQ
jgi:hypothetical protein